MNSKLKIGLSYSDFRYDEYVNYLKSSPREVEVVKLNYEINNVKDLLGCDGLVLSGGKDVNPAIYGKGDEISLCGKILPERDEFELELVKIALDKKLPIFGICRGHQIVNISPAFGGSLHCDISSMSNNTCLEHSNKLPQGVRHKIIIEDGTILKEIMGSNSIEVNSFHHQSIDRVGKGLKISSRAEDGVVESLEWESSESSPFIILVQWHPERLITESSSKLLINYYYNKIKT